MSCYGSICCDTALLPGLSEKSKSGCTHLNIKSPRRSLKSGSLLFAILLKSFFFPFHIEENPVHVKFCMINIWAKPSRSMKKSAHVRGGAQRAYSQGKVPCLFDLPQHPITPPFSPHYVFTPSPANLHSIRIS